MSNFSVLLFLVLMLGMTFFMQNKQKKQMQERQDELKRLAPGTEVVTIGGLYATVDEVDVEQNTVVLDADGIYLTFELSAIKRIIQASERPALVDEDEANSVSQADGVIIEADQVND